MQVLHCFVMQTFEAATEPGRCHFNGIQCNKRLMLQTLTETDLVPQTRPEWLEQRQRATFSSCNEQIRSEDIYKPSLRESGQGPCGE